MKNQIAFHTQVNHRSTANAPRLSAWTSKFHGAPGMAMRRGTTAADVPVTVRHYPARASSSVWPSKPLHVITRQFIELQNPRMKTANYKVKLTLYGRRSFQRQLLRQHSDCDNASKRTSCQKPPDCVAWIPTDMKKALGQPQGLVVVCRNAAEVLLSNPCRPCHPCRRRAWREPPSSDVR